MFAAWIASASSFLSAAIFVFASSMRASPVKSASDAPFVRAAATAASAAAIFPSAAL